MSKVGLHAATESFITVGDHNAYMAYTNQEIVDAVDEHGEITLVFDSGQEYEAHPFTLEETDDDELVLRNVDVEGEDSASRDIFFTGDIVEYYYRHYAA